MRAGRTLNRIWVPERDATQPETPEPSYRGHLPEVVDIIKDNTRLRGDNQRLRFENAALRADIERMKGAQ